MPRTKASLLNDLSTADLKRLLAARERIDTLEKEKSGLLKALAAIDNELKKLMAEATGKKTKATRKKAGRKKTARKTTARRTAAGATAAKKKTARKKVTKTVAKKVTKKVTKKISAKKTTTKVKLEDVVAAVIGKKKGPVKFQDLYAAIVSQGRYKILN